ncbi:unnamed protein product, partial [Scytosiphon promiscuus]
MDIGKDDGAGEEQPPEQQQAGGRTGRDVREEGGGGDLDSLFAMMAFGDLSGSGITIAKLPTPSTERQDIMKNKKRSAGALVDLADYIAVGSSPNDSDNRNGALLKENDEAIRVRVDRAGRSLEDRKLMNDHIYQRLGFFRPLLLQEDFVETLRSQLQTHLGNMSNRLYSSAKVRLCGSWAAQLATRASDVNFTVLLEPRSFFEMLDAKKQEAQMKVDHPELHPILAEIQMLHNRWKDCCDAMGSLETARDEAARDVERDKVKFKFPEKWSLSGIQLKEFKKAASTRSIKLADAENRIKAALEKKQNACKAIAEWEESIPPDKEELMDQHHKLQNAIANLSSKYQEDVGKLTYHVAQEAKRCGFEILEVQREGLMPFAKLVHPNLRTIDNKPIPVKIEVNNHHAVFTSRFVKNYVDMDPRIESFLLFVRLWAGSRGVCSREGSLSFHAHTMLALHFLLASGYVPSILPAHGRKPTPDEAYGASGSTEFHVYSVSGKGKFHDGVDFHFFKDREPPEMPAAMDLSKRATPLERSVRRKSTYQGKASEEGGEREVESGDAGNGTESYDGLDERAVLDLQEPCLCRPGVLSFKDTITTAAVVGSTKEEGKGRYWRSPAIIASGDGPIEDQMRPMPDYVGGGNDEVGSDEKHRFGSDGQSKCGGDEGGGFAQGDDSLSAGTPNLEGVRPSPSSSEKQLVGWSELLMVDIVLAYFRYYAKKKTGYNGMTFSHRTQVASLRPAVVLPKTVWKGQTPEWRTSVEDPFRTYEGHEARDLGVELQPDEQSRLHDEWIKGLEYLEGGQEGDIGNLLQLSDADDLNRTAYTLNMKQPRNGFFDTPAFRRIRSDDLDSARRNRTIPAFKAAQQSRLGKHKAQTSNSRGPFRGQSSSSASVLDSRRVSCTRGFETKQEGKGQK